MVGFLRLCNGQQGHGLKKVKENAAFSDKMYNFASDLLT